MPEITDPELLKRLNAGRTSEPDTAGTSGRGERKFQLIGPEPEIDLLRGVAQGLIDPVEGIVQLAEKSTGWKMAPESLRNWAREFRSRVQSSGPGIAGEVVGNVAPALFSGGMTAMPLTARLVAGAAGGAMQPVSGSADYWKTKLGQSVLGGVAGGSLPALAAAASAAPRWAASKVLPKAVMHWWPQSTGQGTLTNLAQRLGAAAPGRVAGEVRGARPYELQRTSEGLPYYQAQPDAGPQTVDRTRKGNLRRGDDDGEAQSTSR